MIIHSAQTKANPRAFCFTVIVWGERFRNFLLDFCIASLLAPKNIPALHWRRPVKFMIATTVEDWRAISTTAIFHKLQSYADPVFVEIPPCPPDRPVWSHTIVGHRLCADAVAREKSYLVLISPDCVFSNGTVLHLHQLAIEGFQAVLHNVQPRIIEELFLPKLKERGILSAVPPRNSGEPLVCETRELVSAAIACMHSMTVVNEWDAPYFCGYAAGPWRRVAGVSEGFVSCSMFWSMILTDFAAVTQHDSSVLEKAVYDGDYQLRTFEGFKRIYTIRDSDEIYIASWSPAKYQECPVRVRPFGELGRRATFRSSYYGPAFNSLHRGLLFVPTRVHSGGTNGAWESAEDELLKSLLTWVEPPKGLTATTPLSVLSYRDQSAIESRMAGFKLPWWRTNAFTWHICSEFILPLVTRSSVWLEQMRISYWSKLREIAKRILWAARGDASARDWVTRRVRRVLRISN